MPEVKFNKDELVPPTFVDQQFIVDMVRGVEEDPELKVTKALQVIGTE